ncbi:hypothetical protein YC2023_028157 [Brassica napus]
MDDCTSLKMAAMKQQQSLLLGGKRIAVHRSNRPIRRRITYVGHNFIRSMRSDDETSKNSNTSEKVLSKAVKMVSACLCEFCQVDLISIEAIKDGIKSLNSHLFIPTADTVMASILFSCYYFVPGSSSPKRNEANGPCLYDRCIKNPMSIFSSLCLNDLDS